VLQSPCRLRLGSCAVARSWNECHLRVVIAFSQRLKLEIRMREDIPKGIWRPTSNYSGLLWKGKEFRCTHKELRLKKTSVK
jgi:hypothetical protein